MLSKLFVFIIFGAELIPSAAPLKEQSSCGKRNWQCNDGSCIRSILKCDGQADCKDESDESEETCSNNVCADGMFRCRYGACVNSESICNGEVDCIDGSDEDKDLCYKSETTPRVQAGNNDCEIPPNPKHGSYRVTKFPLVLIENDIDLRMILTVSCEPGYKPDGVPMIFCRSGNWERIPQCFRPCKLKKNPNLKFYCPTPEYPTRECEGDVPSGFSVITECKDGNYFSPNDLKCSDGSWDNIPTCKPECGRVTQETAKLTPVGDRAVYSPAPWHATLYSKLTRSRVCGGTLVSATVVVSAAHCFWDSAVGQLPAPTYRLVVGTTRRQPTSDLVKYRQQRDVNEILIPNSFDGTSKSLEYDIALVTVAAPFQFSPFVTPVCLDFDPDFNERQLSENMLGRFASWDDTTDELKTLDLSYVPAATCAKANSAISQVVTGDQICAGLLNGTAEDKGSAGAGLAFPNIDRGVERFYLRGVASVPGTTGSPMLFTQIVKHQMFIGSKIGLV